MMNVFRLLILLPVLALLASCSFLTPLYDSPHYANSQALPELLSHHQLVINHDKKHYHYEVVMESRQGVSHILVMAAFGRPVLSYTLDGEDLNTELQALASLPISTVQLFSHFQQIFWPRDSLLNVASSHNAVPIFEPLQRQFFQQNQLDVLVTYDNACLWQGTTTLTNKADHYSLQFNSVLSHSALPLC